MIKKIEDLHIYKLSEEISMKIFWFLKDFPKEEKYSLTDQIQRSSRSIAANIAEGWGSRIYPKLFKKHLVYAMGSLEETKSWLRFSKKCGYITQSDYLDLLDNLEEIGAKIYLFAKKVR